MLPCGFDLQLADPGEGSPRPASVAGRPSVTGEARRPEHQLGSPQEPTNIVANMIGTIRRIVSGIGRCHPYLRQVLFGSFLFVMQSLPQAELEVEPKAIV